MAKFLKCLLCFLLGVAVSAGALCIYVSTDEHTNVSEKNTYSDDAGLVMHAMEIAGYIMREDYDALSGEIHPEKGVLFSPYAYINPDTDKVFTFRQVADFESDRTKYIWGIYDGLGDVIELTPSEFFKKFLCDHDYTSPDQIGIDTIVRTGNTLENIDTQMPDIRYVDLYVAGSNDADWGSLRLGFESYNGKMKLVLIMHSQWTI